MVDRLLIRGIGRWYHSGESVADAESARAPASTCEIEIMNPRRKSTLQFSARSSSLAILCLCLGTSCIAIVPYEPKTSVLQTLGEEEAAKRFDRLLTKSTDWRFNVAEAGKDHFDAEKLEVILGAFWVQHTVPSSLRIYYADVSRIEVYENNVVYLRNPSGVVTLKATFPSRDAAFEFADLVASYKAQAGGE